MNTSTGIEHPSWPIGTGYWDYVRAELTVQAELIEPNPDGPGTMLTEIRVMDPKGGLVETAIDGWCYFVPSYNYQLWVEVINKVENGIPLY